MYSATRTGENRLDAAYAGKIDQAEMRALLDDLFRKAEGIRDGRMLMRVGDFSLPTLGAVGVELSRFPELFQFIRQFDRVAILVDKAWVRALSRIEGALIPGLEIKAFPLEQEAAAEAWLKGGPSKA